MENNVSAYATEALQYIDGQLPPSLKRPKVGVVCGSGLGVLAEAVLPDPRHEMPYRAIPHFPQSTGDPSSCPPQLLKLTT